MRISETEGFDIYRDSEMVTTGRKEEEDGYIRSTAVQVVYVFSSYGKWSP